jgi:hypothetical protein
MHVASNCNLDCNRNRNRTCNRNRNRNRNNTLSVIWKGGVWGSGKPWVGEAPVFVALSDVSQPTKPIGPQRNSENHARKLDLYGYRCDWFFYLSVYMDIYLSIHLSIDLSIDLSICSVSL